MKKNLLFITWDGDSVSYMDSLFLPILENIKKQTSKYDFEVLQFTWASQEQIDKTRTIADQFDIKYSAQKIHTSPNGILGKIYTVFLGIFFLKKYIRGNNITHIIARSTMPALMVNKITKSFPNVKLIFDADGLPLEERLEYTNLKENDFQYRFLKKQENLMINRADAVLTRSKKAIKILQDQHKNQTTPFFTVTNGRDTEKFKFRDIDRQVVREQLNISTKCFTIIYSGSLGPKYGLQEMIYILSQLEQAEVTFHFIVLTKFVQLAEEQIPQELKKYCTIKTVHFDEVSSYLSASDLAFSLIRPSFSMQAATPIKLGEYLLNGLPTIASIGIGDTEELLQGIPFTFTIKEHSDHQLDRCVHWIKNLPEFDKNIIRDFGIENFSIETSAKNYIKALNSL
jgi:glycosyltransferase involved in cell wall biosynthesis